MDFKCGLRPNFEGAIRDYKLPAYFNIQVVYYQKVSPEQVGDIAGG